MSKDSEFTNSKGDADFIVAPAYYPLIQEFKWNYTSQPDPNLGGNSPEIAQGRAFGGGSAINGMAYCRGASSIFDSWAKSSGNPGLAWSSLLEDFKATSRYGVQASDLPQQVVNTTVFGNGPLDTSRTSGDTGFDIPWANAMKQGFGVQEVDLTDGTGIGLDMGIAAIKAGDRTRSYARNTFGSLLENRRNAQMIPNAWVTKVGFRGKKATSVTYVDTVTSKTRTLNAKEIILSNGAINTPQLLMLSGVGPKERLSNLKIPVVADIPSVGQNLYDHPIAATMLEVTSDIKTVWQWAFNGTEKVIAEQQYAKDRSGPLGWNNGFVYATIRAPDSIFDGVDGTHYTSMPVDRPHLIVEYSTVPFISTSNTSLVTAWVSLVQAEAPGYVDIPSSSYKDMPLINSNYYGSPADKRVITWAYGKLRTLMASKSMKSVVVRESYPGKDVPNEDAQNWKAIQNASFSFHHPMGTVALGKALDKNWRVKGLQGLRVVGSASFPGPSGCHPLADVYAIAHRAAKDISKADN